MRQERRWLKELLKERRLTQEEVSKLLGVSQELVSNWITGYRKPGMKHLKRLAEVLEMPEKELFLREGIFSKDFFEVSPDMVLVPLLSGSIPCGIPTERFDDYIDALQPIPREFLEMAVGKAYQHGLRVYFIRALGDSMLEAGIVPGGLVCFSPDIAVQSGDIAVLEVDEEGLTIKQVFFRGKTVVLQPKNSRYEPRILDTHEVSIKGKVLFTLNYLNHLRKT
ncbi:MAG: S24 family peptidase [Atribacterota bacterium]